MGSAETAKHLVVPDAGSIFGPPDTFPDYVNRSDRDAQKGPAYMVRVIGALPCGSLEIQETNVPL